MNERHLHLVGEAHEEREKPCPSHQEPERWYVGLPLDTVHALEQRVQRINAMVAQATLDMGRELVEAHKEIQALKAGGFQAWVNARIGISEQDASQLMAVYERFGERSVMVLSRFAQTALLLLSAPSVPSEARDEARVRTEAGDTITVQRAKDLIEAQRAQPCAEEAAQAAQTDAQRLRQQIEQHQASSREATAALEQQIRALHEALASRPESEAQGREVDRGLSAVTATLEPLQANVRERTDQQDCLLAKARQPGEELVALRETTQAERE
ncbi:MAG TPA: DUF3102 domain-containing protein [Ktedonobacteraceae bacterium]|nr:DUF3102 domain-containing protein [Ktedonobacteraceae bacterium]